MTTPPASQNHYQWEPTLSVGVLVIDDDHQKFFAVADLFNVTCEHHLYLQEVENAIGTLLDYVRGHFRREELAMESANFPGLKAHKEEHERFSTTIEQLVAAYYAGFDGAASELGQTLAEWLTHHIKTIDRQYINWITDANIDSRPLHEVSGCLNQDELDSVW